MAKKERLPKAEYFRRRYKNSLEVGLTKKAEYYKSRLEQMGEPLVQEQFGKLTRSEFFDGQVVVYAY